MGTRMELPHLSLVLLLLPRNAVGLFRYDPDAREQRVGLLVNGL